MSYRSTQECACRSTEASIVKLADQAAVPLTACAYYQDDDRVSQSRLYSICSPDAFFSPEFVQQIAANRSDPQQQWIFSLIKGQVTQTEVVCLDGDE